VEDPFVSHKGGSRSLNTGITRRRRL